jgi:hypothetical protein
MRKKLFQWIFSLGTALNILILCHIHTDGILRAGITDNYMTKFGIIDIAIFIALSIISYFVIEVVRKWCLPFISRLVYLFRIKCLENFFNSGFGIKIFLIIFLCWFFFFLVFYPGTAMNDTIFICANPSLLTNQHPAMYVYYTYEFYYLGVMLGNPNLGLVFISLLQLVWMDYVVTYGIRVLRNKGASNTLCVILACYFGIAPLFGTYAVSAIKDTPFAIAVFWLMIMIYDVTEDDFCNNRWFWIKAWICVFIMAGFRSNGFIIAVGMGLVVFWIYKRYRKKFAIIFISAIFCANIVNSVLTPDDVKPLFQEKIGIPLQQVAAAVNKGTSLTESQREYLFKLLPEDKWSLYGTGCVDNIKWNDEFDREYLNETKAEFVKIWLEIFPNNIGVYMEAYILNTYGIWGIETRNGEQYYQKKIYDNDIGLYQDSPLPGIIAYFFQKYYCNRFTYGYLSEGTSFWVMFGLLFWLIYRKKYSKICVFAPMIMNFISLMLATPIAFSFRYVFTMALAFPFMILMPFVKSDDKWANSVNLKLNS